MLTTITGLVGRGIAFGEWLNGDGFGIYQHAGIVLSAYQSLDGWAGTVMEAQPGGARRTPLATYQDRDTVFVSPAGLTPAQRRAICTAACAYEGVPYSFLDYAALGAHRLHLPVPHLRDYIATTGHQICSQLCDNSYTAAGVHLFQDVWPGYVTPMDLWNLLRQPADNVLLAA
jgi:hypothetical protein